MPTPMPPIALDPLEHLCDRLIEWTALAEAGFTVSICCGPTRQHLFRWSVDVLTPDGHTFERPYAANSLLDAIAIAGLEVRRRGWWPT